MDSRGYGRRAPQATWARHATAALTLGGLLGAALGCYGLLDTTAPAALGLPMLLAGIVPCGLGLRVGGRAVRRSVYRPDPWLAPEWLVAASGGAAAAALLLTARLRPEALTLPLQPLVVPELPLLAVAGLLLAALPAVVAPPPPRSRRESR
jgi:energy-coupling factor transport system permease protein